MENTPPPSLLKAKRILIFFYLFCFFPYKGQKKKNKNTLRNGGRLKLLLIKNY